MRHSAAEVQCPGVTCGDYWFGGYSLHLPQNLGDGVGIGNEGHRFQPFHFSGNLPRTRSVNVTNEAAANLPSGSSHPNEYHRKWLAVKAKPRTCVRKRIHEETLLRTGDVEPGPSADGG